MRLVSIHLIGVMTMALALGCGTSSGGGGAADGSMPAMVTPDGLVEVEYAGTGKLFLRESHGIGGYDAIAVAPSFVNYRRTSARLDPEDEDVYLVSLEQAILDVAEAANVEVRNELGPCVIKVGAGFVNVDLARSPTAAVWGRMTLVIEYQDSVSGQTLLRYYAEQHIDREAEGQSRDEKVAQSFDKMIEGVNMIQALRHATAKPSKARPGCSGSLIRAGEPTAANASKPLLPNI